MAVIRQVWARNLEEEFRFIHNAITSGYRLAAIDTEYPGTIYDPLPEKAAYAHLHPQQYYSILKHNVDNLQIIQLGLTLFDANGNLPYFNGCHNVWQFNFCDFDKTIHPHNKDSISLLEKQGIDFFKNKRDGIDSIKFAVNFGLILQLHLTWVTFHGSYDFAFLIKTMTRQNLPDDVGHFMWLVGMYFGVLSFDVKVISKVLGYCGGLEKLGQIMGLERVAGKFHQAGSDSLLTMKLFKNLSRKIMLDGLNYKLYGLTC